jgi:hypothetical protein
MWCPLGGIFASNTQNLPCDHQVEFMLLAHEINMVAIKWSFCFYQNKTPSNATMWNFHLRHKNSTIGAPSGFSTTRKKIHVVHHICFLHLHKNYLSQQHIMGFLTGQKNECYHFLLQL